MRSRLHDLDVTLVRYLRPRGLRAAAAFTAVTALLGVAALASPRAAHAQGRIPAAPPSSTSAASSTELTPSVPDPNAPVRVVFGATTLAGSESDRERLPYRDPTDGAVCLPPESLAALGVTHIVDERAGKATFLVGETGKTATVDLRAVPEGSGRKGLFVPAVETLEALGGQCRFDSKTGTLSVRAVLTEVQMLGGQLRIQATLPVVPKITGTNNNRLIIIDIPGAVVGALPKNLTIADPNVDKARSGQFMGMPKDSQDVARVVLEVKSPSGFVSLNGDRPVAQLVLNPLPANALQRRTPIVVTNKPSSAPVAKAAGGAKKPAVQKAPPTLVRAVAFERVSDTQARIILRAGRAPSAVPSQGDGRLVFSLPNVTLAAGAGDGLEKAEHPFLKGVELIARGANVAQLSLELTRAVIFSVRMEPGRGLVIDLGLPRGAGGKIAGKTVIVDAGHGGTDRGARGTNGSYEKNVNFAISRKLADDLREMDANVIMTRDTDEFVPLGERSFIANRAGADFFISVHADSAGASARGSTVYYHADLPSSRTLAQCIAGKLGKLGDLPTKGARSDYRLYPGDGLSVLRRSQMVAVLVECGYMSNGNDVRLLIQPGVQDRIARGIAEGLREYVEGNPDVDTRFLNPRGLGDDGGIRAGAAEEATGREVASGSMPVAPGVMPPPPSVLP